MANPPEPLPGVAATHRVREGGNERRGLVGLDRNERVGALPEWFVAEVRAALDGDMMAIYPQTDDLHDELAAATGLAPERLLVTPGNDPAIRSAYLAYVAPGDSVAMLDPSYAMMRVYAQLFGAETRLAGFDGELRLDADALLAAVRPGTKLVLIANPNQPTGTVVDPGLLEDVLSRAEEHGALVFLDEAYNAFAPEQTLLPLLDAHPNLVVARTFSKIGMAGLRIGWIAGDPSVVATFHKVRSAGEVNAVAIAAARVALRHPELGADYAAEVSAGRSVLERSAAALGLQPLPTHANFLQLRAPAGSDVAAIVAGLRERGWIVRGPAKEPCLAGTFRVTLGPPALMERFADALADVVATLR